MPKHLKPGLLLHLLRDPQMDMVLVFSRMKHGADRIARHLEQNAIRTATLHSNRSQNQRLRAYKRIAQAVDAAEREKVEQEFADRYGPVPDDVRDLDRLADRYQACMRRRRRRY